MSKPRIFISSTFYDLKHVREELYKFIEELGYEPVANEYGDIAYGNQEHLDEYCYKEIKQCDILVSIVGGRYGANVDGQQCSVSQKELTTALELNKQVYIFIDQTVRAEFTIYLKNKGKDIDYYSDKRIFPFIEEISQLPKNNSTFSFTRIQDITDILRVQWAGLFKHLLQQSYKEPQKKEISVSSTITISQLLNKYLIHCKSHNSARTYEYYTGHIGAFLKYLGKDANKLASTLEPAQLIGWPNSQNWSDTYTRGAITAIQVPYNWAVKRKHLAENPLRSMEKPKAVKRNNLIPQDDFNRILGLIDEKDSFRDLLLLMWHIDCRPEEIRNLKAEYVKLDRKVILLPQGIGRVGQKSRPINLNDTAVEILAKLIARQPTGKLFLNRRGTPWTKWALCNRLHRYSKAIGISYALSDFRNGAFSNAASMAA